ncbi:TonB-dependent receptor [Sphingomonas sp. S2-65]|uniref:TonB-dependent receptor n=1 Tax=Sphingomonas sp. S2-65 TaxID=2903960 RepID=UPI001F323C38|nr:TonB-dependent receptor plug domain-containing protein [Sphingomonas sp. S2-65]UYY57576.1 TonB-dependent receptor plug domain-containing protein [Sphingomonas sp. S2-65]
MKCIVCSAGMLLAMPAMAQEAERAEPQEIIVTGRGLDVPPGEAAYDVVAIDRGRLANTASGRLEDVLRDVAGIAQFRRSDSRSAHPTSQGITLRGLGGNASSRALVILDGVPQTDPFGGWVAFPAYLPDRLAAIRVTRGGGSGYAGPGALAGTVELISGSPDDLGPLQLRAAYGSRDSVDTSAVASAHLSGGFVTAAAQYNRGNGFTPIVAEDRGPADRPAPYEQASLALRSVFDVGAGTELQANLSGFRDRRDRGVDYTGVRSDGADASLRLVNRGKWGWSALAYLQTRSFASGFASVNDTRTAASPTLDQYNVPATGIGGRFEIAPPLGGGITLRLGGDVRNVSGRTQELYTFVGGAPTRNRVAGGESTTVGGFADASYQAGPLTLNLGGRIDRWTISGGSLVERPLAGGPLLTDIAFPNRRGWEGSWRAGAAWDAGTVTVRAAGYRGWRLPTLNELYRPFRAGADATAANAALAPERLIGAEAGLDWRPVDAVTLRATAHWSRLDDGIANVTIANGPGTFPSVGFVSAAGVYRQRQNLDAVEARGVELDGRVTHGPFSLSASYAYTDSRVHASNVAAPLDGLRPAQTAEHQASTTLAWFRDALGASLTARYIGPQFEDDQNSRALADAITFDALVAVPVSSELAVEARAENLTDARVEATISGPGIIERATPRTLWIGVRYRMH